MACAEERGRTCCIKWGGSTAEVSDTLALISHSLCSRIITRSVVVAHLDASRVDRIAQVRSALAANMVAQFVDIAIPWNHNL